MWGYGAKAAAGWELITEGPGYLVLRNGTHSGYVCFTFTEDYSVRIYLAETYTGMDGYVMAGDGLKSGTAAGVTVPQRLILSFMWSSDATASWYVIADESAFYFASGGGYSALEEGVAANTNTRTWKALYVGEDTFGNFISVGGSNAQTDSYYVTNYFSARGFTALKDPNTGLLIGSDILTPAVPVLAESGAGRGSLGVLPDAVHLCPVSWGKSGALVAGALKGVVACPDLLRVAPSHAAQGLGLSGPLTTRTLNSTLNLGDGHAYFMGFSSAYDGPLFMTTDHPEFW